jgi:hypothetical protein
MDCHVVRGTSRTSYARTNQTAGISYLRSWIFVPFPTSDDSITSKLYSVPPRRQTEPLTIAAATVDFAMGIWDAFTDIVEAVTPWTTAYAEAPVEAEKVSWRLFFFEAFPTLCSMFAMRVVCHFYCA